MTVIDITPSYTVVYRIGHATERARQFDHIPAGPYIGGGNYGLYLNSDIPYQVSPGPESDGIDWQHIENPNNAYGFATPEQAAAWFGCVADDLARANFRVWEIKVPAHCIVRGGRQIVFEAHTAQVLRAHDPLDFFKGRGLSPEDRRLVQRDAARRRAEEQNRDARGRFITAKEWRRRRNLAWLIQDSIRWFDRRPSDSPFPLRKPTPARYLDL